MEKINFVGRWNVTEERAITTAPGAYFEFRFSGENAVMHFDTAWLTPPVPHLWISVDGGSLIEAQVDTRLRIHAREEPQHKVRAIFKSANEMAHRWYEPLCGRVELTGIDADALLPMPAEKKPRIEFVGDSITEGILIDSPGGSGSDWFERPYVDDSAATYAWLTAEALGAQPLIVGYGGVGVTRGGSGGVPTAREAYPYCYHNVLRQYASPDMIVINYGANDRRNPSADFCAGYSELLDVVDGSNTGSTILVLSPFCGAHEEPLAKLIARYAQTSRNRMAYISSRGWLPEGAPIHPDRRWHKTLAAKLTEQIKKLVDADKTFQLNQ